VLSAHSAPQFMLFLIAIISAGSVDSLQQPLISFAT
jgi:hypothetical protein